jgi:putative ABC transport system substrate-binding protein
MLDMRRRQFITLLVGAAANWPRATRAQQRGKIPRIGIMDNAPIWDHFRNAMRDLGYVDGQTATFEYRRTGGIPERMDQAAAELARIPVDLIATFGTPASKAAKQATSTIPVVMVSIGDPIGAGLVTSIARPGGNLTGNTILGPQMAAKRMQLLKEVLPNLSRVAFLRNLGNASNILILDELFVAARTAGVQVIAVDVRSASDFDSAFASMMQQNPDALMLTNDPLQQLNMPKIIDFLARNKVPGMFQARENVVVGGLISYGASLPDLFRRAAGYAHKILKGTKPADLPIELPTKFELVINLKTAKGLGLDVPLHLQQLADEVIE